MMKFFLKSCLLLLFAAAQIFAQDEIREQGLVTNDPFWRQALGGAVLSLPSVQAQSAVVALDGGNIRAYSTAGKPLWNFSARGKLSPFVTRSREGSSYFSRTNGIFIAVNRAGRELWRRDLGAPLCAGVVTGWDGRLFVPVEKKIFCYTASGTLLWTKVFESPFLIAPKLDHNGGIVFALNNNEIYSMDHFGNAKISPLAKAPVVLVPASGTQIIAMYKDGTMETLKFPEDEKLPAKKKTKLPLFSKLPALPKLPSNPLAAIGKDGNIAVIMNDGRLAFVSVDNRKIIWSGDTHIREIIKSGGKPDMEAEMLFDERGIYVLTKNGATGFTKNGKRLWFTNLHNAASIPAFGNDGVLYSGGKDWILYSYKIEDRVLPEINDLYGPIPEGTYGMGRPQVFDTLDIPLSENEKTARLAEITEGINSGNVGENEPVWTSFLLTISAGKEYILLRLGALKLLGKIGSQETIPWLVNIFLKENEPAIRTAVVLTIGEIGVDPEGLAIETFLHSITYDGSLRDETILIALAQATGALCRFSGPPLSGTGVRILTLLSAPNHPQIVRRQANRELSSLK
jgi:outer membrane protein assembly factor BamB